MKLSGLMTQMNEANDPLQHNKCRGPPLFAFSVIQPTKHIPTPLLAINALRTDGFTPTETVAPKGIGSSIEISQFQARLAFDLGLQSQRPILRQPLTWTRKPGVGAPA